jgi:hypothetical protein
MLPMWEKRQAAEAMYEPAGIDGVRVVALACGHQAMRQLVSEGGTASKIEQVLDFEGDGRTQYALQRITLLGEHDRQSAVFLCHVALDGGGFLHGLLEKVTQRVF